MDGEFLAPCPVCDSDDNVGYARLAARHGEAVTGKGGPVYVVWCFLRDHPVSDIPFGVGASYPEAANEWNRMARAWSERRKHP